VDCSVCNSNGTLYSNCMLYALCSRLFGKSPFACGHLSVSTPLISARSNSRTQETLSMPLVLFGLLLATCGSSEMTGWCFSLFYQIKLIFDCSNHCHGAGKSPVYTLAVAMLVINYVQICLPCIIAILLIPVFCFCMPCLIRVLARIQEVHAPKVILSVCFLLSYCPIGSH
jgi:hypothetical protein